MSSTNPSWLGSGASLTSAGLNPNFMGYSALTGSNTTITNSNVSATSLILLTPVSPGLAGTNMPAINAVSAGSFTVIVSGAGAGRPAGVNYFIMS